jgi:hypothetical protein
MGAPKEFLRASTPLSFAVEGRFDFEGPLERVQHTENRDNVRREGDFYLRVHLTSRRLENIGAVVLTSLSVRAVNLATIEKQHGHASADLPLESDLINAVFHICSFAC